MSELSLHNLQTIVNKSGIGILILNSETKIILTNLWFQRFSGLNSEAILYRPLLEVFPELQNTRTEKSIKICLEDHQYSILTHTLNPYPFPLYENDRERDAGKRIYQYLHIIPLPIKESDRSLCMIQISDVSQQVIRENMLREQTLLANTIKEQAVRASNAKSDFLASMSHEIRTPLNSILGMTELLEETSIDHDQKRYIDVLRNSGKALFNIINDILDFSKIEAGKLEIDNHPFSLISVIDETMSMFFLRAKNKGIHLESNIFPGISTSVYGDPIRLQQILINLIGNAIKFTHEGFIQLKITHELNTIDNREHLLIQVIDTGIGIPKEKLNKIFESFSQVDSSTTRQYGGTGLGLAISKKLTELLGGKIEVRSEFGTGSTFSIRLPYLPYIENVQVPTITWDGIIIPEPSTFPKLKLLLAEDSPENVFVVQSFLRKYPIEIDIAENGLIALDKSGMKDYSLILMDMQMPLMDGTEAIRQIRNRESKQSIHAEKSVPIVALTANVAKEDIQRSFEAGCNSYLTKPVKKEDLIRIIFFYASTQFKST